jgi:hypothetical protein
MANTVVNEWTVMIEALYTLSTSLAMNSGR